LPLLFFLSFPTGICCCLCPCLCRCFCSCPCFSCLSFPPGICFCLCCSNSAPSQISHPERPKGAEGPAVVLPTKQNKLSRFCLRFFLSSGGSAFSPKSLLTTLAGSGLLQLARSSSLLIGAPNRFLLLARLRLAAAFFVMPHTRHRLVTRPAMVRFRRRSLFCAHNQPRGELDGREADLVGEPLYGFGGFGAVLSSTLSAVLAVA
jgi:hypothetical protein